MIPDLRPFIFSLKTRILPKSFEEWRDRVVFQVDYLCKIHREEIDTKVDSWIRRYKDIMKFPKAIVRITRQMCSCDEYCLKYSMYYTKFDEQCTFYDLKNLMTDDLYYKSSFVDKVVIYSRLENEDCAVDEFSLKRSIYNGLVRLCNNGKYDVRELKCLIYELKDHCKSNDTCYNSMLDYNPVLASIDRRIYRENCSNKNFENDLANLQSKIYFSPILRSKREVNNFISDKLSFEIPKIEYKVNSNEIMDNLGYSNEIMDNIGYSKRINPNTIASFTMFIPVTVLTIYLLKKKNFISAILLVFTLILTLFAINIFG